jgi:hypothetical protein
LAGFEAWRGLGAEQVSGRPSRALASDGLERLNATRRRRRTVPADPNAYCFY